MACIETVQFDDTEVMVLNFIGSAGAAIDLPPLMASVAEHLSRLGLVEHKGSRWDLTQWGRQALKGGTPAQFQAARAA